MGYTGNPWRGGNASPFGTQMLDKGKVSSNLLPAIIGGLGSAFLGPGGPILGSLVGAGLNFGLNRIESGIQNRYNAPKNQLKRLREAGLPGAAYFGANQEPGATSSQTYAQPDLGTAEAISREQVNRMQKQQFELMQREQQVKEAEFALKQQQEKESIARTFRLGIYNDYYGMGGNFARMQQAKENQLWMSGWAQKNAGDLSKIAAEVKRATKDSDIAAAAHKAYNLWRTGRLLKEQEGIWDARKGLLGAQKGLVESQTGLTKQKMTLNSLEEWFKDRAKSLLEDAESKTHRGMGEAQKTQLYWDILLGPLNVLGKFD